MSPLDAYDRSTPAKSLLFFSGIAALIYAVTTGVSGFFSRESFTVEMIIVRKEAWPEMNEGQMY